MSYQNGVSYSFGSSGLDLDNLSAASAKIVELQVDSNADIKGDILMNPGRLVDGVDVSELKASVDEMREDVDGMDGKFVDLTTEQQINGNKWFVKLVTMMAGVRSYGNANINGEAYCHNLITVSPLMLSRFSGDVRMDKNLEMRGDIVMGEGKLVDGVDVSLMGNAVAALQGGFADHTNTIGVLSGRISDNQIELKDHGARIEVLEGQDLSHLVTLDTAQTVSGKKTFTSAVEVKGASGNGVITSGVGIRTANRAEQFLISNGDGVAEFFLGSDTDGTGVVNKNHKWGISSREKSDGRLIFYACPGYTGTFDEKDQYQPGATYDSVMEFKQTKNTVTKKYDCVINLNKPVNIKGDLNVTGSVIAGGGFLEMKDMMWWGPWPSANQFKSAKLTLTKSGRSVTVSSPGMVAGSNPAMSGSEAGTYIQTDRLIPVEYRPEFDSYGLAHIFTNNQRIMTRVTVTPAGQIVINREFNLESTGIYFSGDTGFYGFNVTYHSAM